MKFSIQVEDINGAPIGDPIVLPCPAEAAGMAPEHIATTVKDQRLSIDGSLNGGTCPTAFYLRVKEESR